MIIGNSKLLFSKDHRSKYCFVSSDLCLGKMLFKCHTNRHQPKRYSLGCANDQAPTTGPRTQVLSKLCRTEEGRNETPPAQGGSPILLLHSSYPKLRPFIQPWDDRSTLHYQTGSLLLGSCPVLSPRGVGTPWVFMKCKFHDCVEPRPLEVRHMQPRRFTFCTFITTHLFSCGKL